MTGEGLPPINALGPIMAERRPRLNAAIRAQLEFIAEEAAHYVSDSDQMPHEWGSLDSFDDARNSLAVGLELMDALFNSSEDELEVIRDVIADRGVCASAPGVWDAAFPDEPDDEKRHDFIFERMEKFQR